MTTLELWAGSDQEYRHHMVMEELFPGSPKILDWLRELGFEPNLIRGITYNQTLRVLAVHQMALEDGSIRSAGAEVGNEPLTTVIQRADVFMPPELEIAWEEIVR